MARVLLLIPVTDGATLTLIIYSPSAGFYTFGGYILAPRARIFDGDTGYFAGNIVGKEYAWTAYAKVDGDVVGASIDWYVGPSSCTEFDGYIPIHDDSTPFHFIHLPEPVPAYVTRTVEVFASSKPVSSCDPTTIISAGSVKQITVPGSTVVVGGTTIVIVKETTIEVVSDVYVVTKIDTLVSHVTDTLVSQVTDTVQESCPPNQDPDHRHPHGHNHDWSMTWTMTKISGIKIKLIISTIITGQMKSVMNPTIWEINIRKSSSQFISIRISTLI
ncbi:hypothetical protein MFLAVUS_000344 [Mucor flavus]|uniref:Uncharacterized protein n=1 Tax=Mucor flavus TaxID=439312 RepID=A0ABP9YJE9_9FUNG